MPALFDSTDGLVLQRAVCVAVGSIAASSLMDPYRPHVWLRRSCHNDPVIFQPDPSVCKLPDGPIPLSWHLRKQDKKLIQAAWECELKNKLNCKAVADFVLHQQQSH
jgi:hypothetical protein